MRLPGEIPMKALGIKKITAMGSNSSRSSLKVREPAGLQFASLPATPSHAGRGDRGQKLLYCHILSWDIGGSAAWVAGAGEERKSQNSSISAEIIRHFPRRVGMRL